MLNICCVLAGNYQGRGLEYVSILYDSVKRNLAEGTVGRFICFTDQDGEIPGVIKRVLPEGLNGWWNKLALFRPGLFEKGDRVLYLDLSTVITGRLDEIAKYDGEFAILRDFYRPNGLQSSVMMWRAGFGAHLWEEFEKHGRPDIPGGDQIWIEQYVGEVDILQDKFPGLFASYKVLHGVIPDKASAVVFHGRPKPHELGGWVAEVWKVGGVTRADLDRVMNVTEDRVHANVRAACKRDVAWMDRRPEIKQHVVIVGGGPSVAAEVEMIRWRQSEGQWVWALNGAASWLLDNGIMPDAQVLLDARQETADLVSRADHYYIASQCDPAVLDLIDANRVTLFHANTEGIADDIPNDGRPVHLIGGGSTVGLQGMAIAYLRGFRKMHLYGFDSSLADDKHHAYPQAINDGDRIVDAIYGNRKFRAAPWMVQQAEEFMALARFLVEEDCLITVAGDGLLPHMARTGTMPLSAVELRAQAILSRLPAGSKRGAEIGVFTGALSALLLQDPQVELIMVDAWEGGGTSYIGDSGDYHARLTEAQQNAAREAATKAVAFAGRRARIWQMRSLAAARLVGDGALDFVFIDADHSYAGCSDDIAAWAPKVKPGGWLSGHDYSNPAGPTWGVKRAVDEYAAQAGLEIERGENWTWFIRMPDAVAVAAE